MKNIALYKQDTFTYIDLANDYLIYKNSNHIDQNECF